MKRTKYAILAAAILLTGCQKQKPADPPADLSALTDADVKGSTLTAEITASCTAVPLATKIDSFPRILTCGSYLVLSGWQADTYTTHVCLYDTQTGEITEPFVFPQTLSEEEGCTILGMTTETDGFRIWYRVQNGGDTAFMTERLDSTMQSQGVQPLTLPDGVTYIQSVIRDDRGQLCMLEGEWRSGTVRFFDDDLNPLGRVAGSMEQDACLVTDGDGRVYVCGERSILLVDTEHFETEKLSVSDKPENIRSYCGGAGEFRLFAMNQDGLFGLDGDGNWQEAVNWVHSDIGSEYTSCAAALPGGEFCVGCQEDGMLLLTPRTREELDALQTITLASVNGGHGTVASGVRAYNQASANVRIVITDYSAYGNGDNLDGEIAAFESDLLAGTTPDIVDLDFMPYENYLNKGLFEDLYPFMEADAELSCDDLYQNLFTAMEDDGKLLRLGIGFQVNTVAGKTKFVGDTMGVSLSDYNALAQSLPEGMDFSSFPTNWSIFSSFCRNGAQVFADKKTGECRFDTPEFIEFLEFCGTFPSDRTVYNFEDDTQYAEDRACLDSVRFADGSDYLRIQRDFGGDDVTLIGYPSVGGNGGMFTPATQLAMYSQSQHKAEIWDFFKFLLSEDYQRDRVPGFSANCRVLDEQTADVPQLRAYIDAVTVEHRYDTTLQNMLSEETEMFFAGDCTAEQAARNLQSRASLYINEIR